MSYFELFLARRLFTGKSLWSLFDLWGPFPETTSAHRIDSSHFYTALQTNAWAGPFYSWTWSPQPMWLCNAQCACYDPSALRTHVKRHCGEKSHFYRAVRTIAWAGSFYGWRWSPQPGYIPSPANTWRGERAPIFMTITFHFYDNNFSFLRLLKMVGVKENPRLCWRPCVHNQIPIP